MRVIWGFMLENTYFTEFDLSNHRIIEGAYRQRKTRQTSHYINIRDSHLPAQARVYFGVEQIHLRMPGTRYYVKRVIIASSSPSCNPSSKFLTPPKRQRRNVSRTSQMNSTTRRPSHSATASEQVVPETSSMSGGQGSTTSAMVVPQSDFYFAPTFQPASVSGQSLLMLPHHPQAPHFQDCAGLCSSSSTSTCTSGSSTTSGLDLFSTGGSQTQQQQQQQQSPSPGDIFYLSPWQRVPSQTTSTSMFLGHLALSDKPIPPSPSQEQQHSLLLGAADQTHTTAPPISGEIQIMTTNDDVVGFSPWILDDQFYAFGGVSYLMSSSIQPL